MNRQKSIPLQIIIVTFISSLVTLFVSLGATLPSRAAIQHRHHTPQTVFDAEGLPVASAQKALNSAHTQISLLDFTPVATQYLPLVMNDGPTSTPVAPSPDACNPTNGSGGLSPGIYDTKVAGLNAIVIVGEGYTPDTPTYLGFNIHGDGGKYDRYGKETNPVTQLVAERGWIFVAPLSPNGFSWWQDEVGDHRQAFADVLDEMFAQYNVCRDIVFGSTSSGGSSFWTRMFFPRKGGDYPAHTLIACGGNDINGVKNDLKKVQALGQNSDVVARSTFYYLYGTEDRLVPFIEESITMYSEAGFNVQIEVLEGAGHCNEWKDEGRKTKDEQIAEKWVKFATDLGVE